MRRADRAGRDPYFSAHQARVAAARPGRAAPRRSVASWRPARSRAGSSRGSPVAGCTSAITPTPRARCSTISRRATGTPSSRAVRRPPRPAARGASLAGTCRRDARRSPGDRAADRAASRATSRPRCSARGAAPTGWPRTPTEPGPSCWSSRGTGSRPPRRGCWRPSPVRPAGRAGVCAGGERLHRRRRAAVAPRRARPASASPPSPRRWRAAVPDTGGVYFVPAFVGPGRAALGARGARAPSSASRAARHAPTSSAPRSRRWRYSTRRPAGRDARAAGAAAERCGSTAARRRTTG